MSKKESNPGHGMIEKLETLPKIENASEAGLWFDSAHDHMEYEFTYEQRAKINELVDELNSLRAAFIELGILTGNIVPSRRAALLRDVDSKETQDD